MAAPFGSELKSLFSELVSLEPGERAERLAALGAGDPALRDALAGLLAAEASADVRLARLDVLRSGGPGGADPYGLAGTTVGHFRVEDVLGAGGMGVVYRAQDLRLGREVALKLLPPHLGLDPDARRRFLREARAAAALDHPNIATVFEVGEAEDGRLFHATALYRGETLRQRLARGALPPAEAADIAAQVLRGLAHAHAAGVVHRDLKPENLILTAEGVVKIVDFGLATLPGTATASSRHAGTAAYMAPEQLRGEPVDARSDFWALGVVLYEMLAGRRPFEGDSDLALAHRILTEAPPSVAALGVRVPPTLERFVSRLLERDAGARPASAEAALEEIGTLDRPGQGARSAASGGRGADRRPGTRVRRGTRSRRVAWVLAGLVVGLVAASVALLVFRPWGPRAGAASIRSVAVLPFENLSPEGASPYLGDGIAEQVLDELSRVEGVRTVARTSSFEFQGKNLDVRRIGRQLRVAAVLEGSVTATADRIRVRAELVGTKDGYTIWSDVYDRPRMDVLGLQDDIAGAIATALTLRLRPLARGDAAARSVRPEAYDLYVTARHLWYERTPEALLRAAETFERALAVDSGYAMAYAGLADVQAMLGSFEYAVSPPASAYGRARAAANAALRLNPDLGAAHAALANIAMNYDRDRAGAEREFRRALELSPDYAPAHQWYAFLLASRGRDAEALQQIEEASQADPLSPITATARAQFFYFRRQWGAARQAVNAALELDSSFARAQLIGALVDVQTGRLPAAIDRLVRLRAAAPDDPVVAAVLGYALGRSGQAGQARAIRGWLAERARRRYVPPELRGLVDLGLGDRDHAMEAIEAAVRERSGGVLYLPVDPLLDPLRDDPRFRKLLGTLGS